jgi:PAS domain S-box-containing protein
MNEASAASISLLYVDDEPEFAELVAAQLERRGDDLDILVDTSADAALERLRDGDPGIDCVVSDYEMPNMDGLALLEAVREEWPDLPFVLFTGRGSENIASEAISRGVTEYMQKATDPHQFEVLANRVRNAVEKYKTERQLERTETRYRRLVEQNLTGIYIIQDGDVMYANPKCEEIFGYSQAELVELSAYDLVAEEDHETVRRNIRKRENGEVEEMNYTLTGVRKSGETFEFEVHSGRIDYEGEPALLASLVDVTEQRERERELEQYRELVETVGDPMYVLDENGEALQANRAMAEMLGVDREELLERDPREFTDSEDFEAGSELIRGFIRGDLDPPQTYEFEFQPVDGPPVPCETNITVLTDEEGEFRGSVGVVRRIAERKERERELEEYETIVQTAPDGIFILDAEGTLVSGNQTGAEMVGIDLETLRGRNFSELVRRDVLDDDVADRYLSLVKELLSGESDRQKAKFEATLHPVDGGERTCEIHIALLPEEDGSFRGTVGVVRDITERKAIEEALRDERDRLSALFENIPEPTLVYEFVDGEPVVRRVNDAFEETFGYEKAAVLGGPLDDYIVPPQQGDEAGTLNERVNAGEQLDVELERLTADGEVRDFLLRNAPIPTDDGVQGYAIYTDITERKERERRMEAMHEATRELMDATSLEDVAEIGLAAAERVLGLDLAGVFRHDTERDVLEPIEITGSAEELFAHVPTFERGEGIAWQVFESGKPAVADNVRELDDVYSEDTPVRSEMILPLGDHGLFMAASTDPAAFDQAEQFLAQVLVSNVESALDRARRETLLRRREQALLRQNERLEEFAGVVSHDLRSPLTVAKGNVFLAREHGGEEYLDKIEGALDRMEQLIDDLLSLARQGENVDETALVDLAGTAEEAWSTVDTAEASIDLADGSDRMVDADEGRLRELLENLFGNAVEHGGRDVAVTVGGLAEGFYVEDDGDGFDEGAGEDLFEPGFTTADEGTGFGLSIVRQIAEAHGWEVAVTGGETGGARFEFTGVETLEPSEARP